MKFKGSIKISTKDILCLSYLMIFILYFPGRGWPIAFGLGTGLGMAVSNCQHEFKTISSHLPGVSCFAMSRIFIFSSV